MTEPTENDVTELASQMIRATLGRPDGMSTDDAIKRWLATELMTEEKRSEFPYLHLAVQTAAISDLIGMYEIATKSGLVTVAALLRKAGAGQEECKAMAKDMMTNAGELLLAQELGSTH